METPGCPYLRGVHIFMTPVNLLSEPGPQDKRTLALLNWRSSHVMGTLSLMPSHGRRGSVYLVMMTCTRFGFHLVPWRDHFQD